jgi:hypothetical protein
MFTLTGACEQGALPFLLELDRVVGEREGDRHRGFSVPVADEAGAHRNPSPGRVPRIAPP